MRRIVSWILTIALVLSMTSVTAFAAENSTLQVDGVEEGKVHAGDEIAAVITIPHPAQAVACGNFQVSFNKEVISVLAASQTGAIGTSVVTGIENANSYGLVVVNFSSDSDVAMENDLVITIRFKVKDTVEPGTYTDLIKVDVDENYFATADDDVVDVPAFVEGNDTLSVTIPKAPITSVSATVSAPVKGQPLDMTVELNGATAYTANVQWYEGKTTDGSNLTGEALNKAKADQIYTAKIILVAADGESFAETVTGPEGYTLERNAADKVTLTKTFPQTADKSTPTCTAPEGLSATFGSTLSTITLTNPTGNTPGKWYWMDDTQKVGNVKDNPHTYKAKFVPTDTVSYVTVENIDVTVTATKVVLGTGYPIMIPIEVYYTGSAIEPKPSIRVSDMYSDELVLDQDYRITKYESNTNVGTGKIFIEPLENGNYSFTGGGYSFTIKAATSAISITGDPSKTYDGSAVTAPAVKKSGSTGAVTFTYYTDKDCTTRTTTANGAESDGAAPKNAGTYWVKAILAADSNHGSAISAAKQFTISPKPLTTDMLVIGTQATYDGASHAPVYSVKDGNTALVKDVDYTETEGYNAVTSVGNNTLKITGKGNYTGVVSKDWSLVAKDISQVTIDVTGTYTYTGDAITPNYAVKDGEQVVEDTNYTPEITNNTNVGTATITLTGKGNYQGTKTENFTISAKNVADLTIEAPDQTVVKGDGSFTDPVVKGVKGEALAGTLAYAYGSETGKTHADVVTMLKDKAVDTSITLNYTFTPDSANTNYTGTKAGSFTVTVKDIEFKVGSETASAANALTIKAAPTYGDDWSDIVKIKSDVTITAVAGANTDSNKEHFSLRPTGKPSAGEQTYELIYNGTIGTITYSNVVVASGTVTVAPKTLTKADLTYSGPITKVYDSTTSAPSGLTVFVNPGSLEGNDILDVTGTLAYNSANVNEGNSITFTPVAITTGNYRLAASEVLTITGASITQATPNYTVPTGLTATFGQTLADVSLNTHTGWSWMDGTQSVGNVGTNTFKAKFTPTDSANYKTMSNIDVSVGVDKAAARTLADIAVNQKYTVTTAQSKDIGRAGMPADAGTLTYTYTVGSATVTEGTATVSDVSVDANGVVRYTITDSDVGAKVTIPVTITSTNYEDSTVNVVITLTERDVPEVKANDITVDYTGEDVPASMITGTAICDGQTVAGSWSFKDDAAKFTNVVDSNDSVTVVFTPTDTVNYASVEATIKVTINKAKPTGTPGYTAITAEGKTLADADLTVGTITPAGTIKWVAEDGTDLADDTAVEANKSYSWVFTPTDTANYETLTGSIQLWHKSTGGRYYYSSSNSSGTATITAVLTAKDAKSATDYTSGIYGLTFRSTADFSGFKGVKVDGKTIGKDNYVAESNNGSIEVYLKAAYLKTLAVGRHTLTIMAAGGNASIDFTIGGVNTAPKTFDAGIAVYVTMAVASVTGMAWMGKKRED